APDPGAQGRPPNVHPIGGQARRYKAQLGPAEKVPCIVQLRCCSAPAGGKCLSAAVASKLVVLADSSLPLKYAEAGTDFRKSKLSLLTRLRRAERNSLPPLLGSVPWPVACGGVPPTGGSLQERAFTAESLSAPAAA